MKHAIAAFAALTFLAACGADGEPIRPSLSTTISASENGVRVGTSLGVSKGPVRISVGL